MSYTDQPRRGLRAATSQGRLNNTAIQADNANPLPRNEPRNHLPKSCALAGSRGWTEGLEGLRHLIGAFQFFRVTAIEELQEALETK